MIMMLVVGGLATGCGSAAPHTAAVASVIAETSDSASSSTPEVSTEPVLPVTLSDDEGTNVTITSIDRIIPVDGDLAEIVFALGLGDNVVATDLSATYPPEADALPQIGYQRALSAEPIAALEPTLVLATDLARPVEIIGQLRSLDIPVVVIDRRVALDGPATKIRAVAKALGVPRRGEALIATMQADIDAALTAAGTVKDQPRVLVLYMRGEQTQLIFGKGSGVDVLLPAVGAVDVAAELGIGETQQITAEALVRAAPDVLILSTTGLASVGGIDGLLSIPGIAETPAGKNRRVLAFEDQYLFGAGPRYGQLLLELVHAIHQT
jgi:iron complex transport system substrate-binding protein